MASGRCEAHCQRISRVKYLCGLCALCVDRRQMIRPILRYGDTVLHERARDVDRITPDVVRLVDDMIETMYAAPGIGLAATQVGVPLRIFVVDVSVGRDAQSLHVMI